MDTKTMICPYCGKEMELGYIQSRDGIYWTKNHLITALNWAAKDATSLANGAAREHAPGTVYAFNCEGCKKVIVDYK